jgi:hypothetical protein
MKSMILILLRKVIKISTAESRQQVLMMLNNVDAPTVALNLIGTGSGELVREVLQFLVTVLRGNEAGLWLVMERFYSTRNHPFFFHIRKLIHQGSFPLSHFFFNNNTTTIISNLFFCGFSAFSVFCGISGIRQIKQIRRKDYSMKRKRVKALERLSSFYIAHSDTNLPHLESGPLEFEMRDVFKLIELLSAVDPPYMRDQAEAPGVDLVRESCQYLRAHSTIIGSQDDVALSTQIFKTLIALCQSTADGGQPIPTHQVALLNYKVCNPINAILRREGASLKFLKMQKKILELLLALTESNYDACQKVISQINFAPLSSFLGSLEAPGTPLGSSMTITTAPKPHQSLLPQLATDAFILLKRLGNADPAPSNRSVQMGSFLSTLSLLLCKFSRV